MEAAVSTTAERHSLCVCLLGRLWSHFIHKHGGTVEKYVFCVAQNYWNCCYIEEIVVVLIISFNL